MNKTTQVRKGYTKQELSKMPYPPSKEPPGLSKIKKRGPKSEGILSAPHRCQG